MNHHPLLPIDPLVRTLPVACLGLLLACGTGGNEAATSAVAPATVGKAVAAPPAPNCENALEMTFRHKHYTEKELDSAKVLFTGHFKVLVEGKYEDLQDPVVRIPWSSIEEVQKTIGTTEMPVRGMYISYGLDGTRFHPVLKFLYPDSTGNLQLIPDSCYSFNLSTQKLVTETDPKKYTDAYLENIRVDRIDTGFSALRTTDEADPLATWFPYANNVNQLLKENPYNYQVLVVSCISEKLCYRAISDKTVDPEFRHLIALHIGDGANDQLSSSFDASKPYYRTAMDLGNLCPPRCEPK
jgi:hypothetical protein